MEKVTFPMRINKYLALKGYSTRRGADELVSKGKVFINGRTATLGDKVNEDDLVEVRTSGRAKKALYLAYHKPRGIVTHSAEKGQQDIKGVVDVKGVFPVGRLDRDSSGLIILTNDGRITDRLLNPEHEHDKEYLVKTTTRLRPSFKSYIEKGVDIEGYTTKPAKVKILGERTFLITLSEGKKHQIRRMVSALHNDVSELQRTRILNIKLGKLSAGEYRPIDGEELAELLRQLGLQ
jgi:23S rRNA pseudouridine2604 synthase